jgi:hypothetical protein
MADVLKILGQINPTPTTFTLLYTAPDLSSVTCSSLIVCNRTSLTAQFSVTVHQKDSSTDDKQYIFYEAPLAANTTLTTVLGITLAEGDHIKVSTSTAGFSINLFGVETIP